MPVSGSGKKKSISSDAWRMLYGRAEKIREVAPWRWMQEHHIFGVSFPQNDTVGFVSVMGTLGEHRAVTVYLGLEGLRGFWHVENLEPNEDPGTIIHVPQLMVSFEDRSQLESRDREQIQRLGLSYRGKNAWPLFRSYRPGYYPWFLTPDEVQLLSTALEQTLAVAIRTREDITPLGPDDEDNYLVRIPDTVGKQMTWEDRQMTFHLEPFPINPDLDPDLFNQAVDLGQSGSEFELDCLSVPARIGPKGTRPRWPHMLIVAEAESSAIVGFELLQAVDGLPAMWSKIPEKLLSIISKSSARPAAIWVRSTLYLELLRPLSNALEIDIAKRSDLPAIEEVRESLFEFMTL